MSSWWRTLLGINDILPQETFEQAFQRAKRMLEEDNDEEACRILRHAAKYKHAEGMYLYAWSLWKGIGAREDSGHALALWRASASLGYAPAIERCKELDEERARYEAELKEEEKNKL